MNLLIRVMCTEHDEEIEMTEFERVTPQEWGGNFTQVRFRCLECDRETTLRICP